MKTKTKASQVLTRLLLITCFTVLLKQMEVESASVLVSNKDLQTKILKLEKEVEDLKNLVKNPTTTESVCRKSKCSQCRCVEDPTIPEKHYCDCRRLVPKRDCKAYYMTGYYVPGIYTVTMDNMRTIDMFCDGNGWTVIQRRIDGNTNFYRSWQQYKHGFGKLQGEFWLGNENLYVLSTQALMEGGSELNITMRSTHSWDVTYWAFYRHFSLDSEAANYKLHIKYSYGNADSLTYHDNMEFSTFDRDNDKSATRNCARELHGAWWYNACAESNLNGFYDTREHGRKAEKVDWKSLLSYRTQSWVEMKVMRIGKNY